MPTACSGVASGVRRLSHSIKAASVLLPAPGGAARKAISRLSRSACSSVSRISKGRRTRSTSRAPCRAVRRRRGRVSVSSSTTAPMEGASSSGCSALLSSMTACVSAPAASTESMSSRPQASEVACARLKTRPATLREMGSSAVTEMRKVSSTLAARAKPMSPVGCGPFAGLPPQTCFRRSMASKVSGKAMPSASVPTLSWKSLTAASVWAP